MSRGFDLLVVGELNPDAIIVAPSIDVEYGQVEQLFEAGTMTVGSSGAIVACGAARLGMRTAFAGVVGDDPAGGFMLHELGERGIDTSGCRVDRARPTGLSVVLSRGDDRAILTVPGAMEELAGGDVTGAMLADAVHLHVSSPGLQPRLRDDLASLFERAHAAGATTSLDPGWDPGGAWASALDEAIAATDVLLPNAAEACHLTGTDDPRDALDLLSERVATVAVKLGAAGAIAGRGGETCAVGAPAVAPIDGTGAGDSFAAGFLFAMGDGRSLEESLRLGVACGSLSTRGIGGVEAQPDLTEAVEAAGTITTDIIERNNI